MCVCIYVYILCTTILSIGDVLNDKMHSQLQPKARPDVLPSKMRGCVNAVLPQHYEPVFL